MFALLSAWILAGQYRNFSDMNATEVLQMGPWSSHIDAAEGPNKGRRCSLLDCWMHASDVERGSSALTLRYFTILEHLVLTLELIRHLLT